MSYTCLKYTFTFLVVSFILFGLPFITYYQVVKPKNPTFSVDQAAISGFSLRATGQLTSFFDIEIRAHNPNHKLKLKYRRVRVSVFKDKQNLATDALPRFTQRKGNVTVLRAQPVSLNMGLKKGPIFDFGIESGLGYLDFDVFMMADLNGDNLEVDCKLVLINISAPNTIGSNNNIQKFQSKPCSVLVYSDDA